MIFTISKKKLFDIFKKNGFLYGNKCISSCIPEIKSEITKDRDIVIEKNFNISKIFQNELKNMKRNWCKLKGGNQRAQFLTSLNEQCFSFDAEIEKTFEDFQQEGQECKGFFFYYFSLIMVN